MKALLVINQQLLEIEEKLKDLYNELDRTDSVDAHNYSIRQQIKEYSIRQDQLLKLKAALDWA
jgi:hypothetical protein